MGEDQITRREFIIGAAVAVAGMTGAGFLLNVTYKMDRTTTELSEAQTLEGVVIDKEFKKGEYPVELNPLKRELMKEADKHYVVIQYQHGTVTRNNKKLYDQLEMDEEVLVEFREVFRVKKTYKGELLERTLTGYKVTNIKLIK